MEKISENRKVSSAASSLFQTRLGSLLARFAGDFEAALGPETFDQFIADFAAAQAQINHDIRAPLGVMMGFIDLLKEPDLKTSEIPEFVAILDRNARQLLKMMDDFASVPAKAASAKKPSPSRNLEGMDILIVDDSPDNQYIMSAFLAETGAHVEVASNGKEGIEKILSGSFDLVLMDIQMPEMDGHEATKNLRANGYKKPIVALTAHSIGQEGDKCLRSGFSSFLSKPIQRESLKAEVLKYQTQEGPLDD